MSQQRFTQPVWLWTTLVVCALTAAGCAGLPRIDPTGERIFIWPQNQVSAVSPVISNPQAPPVYTDPVFPRPSTVPGQPGLLVPPVPQDTLSITPQRILAPVGSEVLLKSRFCTREGFLLTDSKVDWMIARESAGEFVSLGGRGWLRNPLLPWNKSKKIDNQFATGYTARVPLTITRGTADLSDDVQVEPGEAWASITSPVEGTSHITALAPEITAWKDRRATATIYWVDVQWTFPATTITASGSHVMTTAVRRQTDGTPLEGWIVRYEVANGGSAISGGQSGQAAESITDANGRASIDMTPTGSAGNTTRMNIQLVRPQGHRGSDDPRLVVANGVSTINWAGSGTDYLPPAADLGAAPLPSQPPIQTPPPATVRRPQLELEIYGDEKAQVGGQTRFEVLIRNKGNAEATGIVLNVRFDGGLGHLKDPNRELQIENTVIGSLAAGDSRSEFLNFDILQAGRLCHTARVTCKENSEAEKQACVIAAQPPPQPQTTMKVVKEGPRQRIVGQAALFTLSVTNTGEVPLTNLIIVDEYPPQLRATPTTPGFQKVPGDDNRERFRWDIPRLEIGANKKFEVQCQCIGQAEQVCSRVKVFANDGAISSADKFCMSILPTLPARDVVPGGAGPPPAVPPVTPGNANKIKLGITARANPIRVGTRAIYEIVIQNGPVDDEQVQLRVVFPAELTPDITSIQTNAGVKPNLVGNELQFEPIKQLRKSDRLVFQITANVNQTGIRDIIAELKSKNSPTAIRDIEKVDIIGR